MEFRLLGPIQVCTDDRAIRLGGARQRQLLALLLLHANRAVSTERLLDELWLEQAPRSGSAAVQNQVARLRKALGPDRVLTQASGYLIRVEPGELDLDRFRELVAAAEASPPEGRAELLREALRLWRGPALGDLPESFAAVHAGSVEEMRLRALEERVDADLALGRHADLVGELSQLAARHPLRERLRGQLILALYRAGRQAEALDVYRETRRMLAEELGLEPGTELRDLERAILNQDGALDHRPRPKADTVAPRPTRARLAVAAVAGGLAVAGMLSALALSRQPSDAESALAPTAAATDPPTPPGSSAPKRSTNANPPPPTNAKPASRAKPKPRRSARTTPATTRAETELQAPLVVATAAAAAGLAPATTTTRRRLAPPSARPATTTTKQPLTRTTVTTAQPTEPGRIADDFDDTATNAAIWYIVTEGSGATFAERDGALNVTIPADAAPGGQWQSVGGHYGTVCRFPGDFDASVEFELVRWPAASGVFVSLATFGVNARISRGSNSWSDSYVSWIPPNARSLEPRASKTKGALRLVRENDVLTTYVRDADAWTPIASASVPGAATLALDVSSSKRDWTGKAVEVRFDDFAVEASTFDCPPGSEPPG